MRACAIAGCELEAVYSLGVRCRRPNTRALWAPNAPVGLCELHGRSGVLVKLELEPLPHFDGVLVACGGQTRSVAFSEAIAS
jgi:hypothetical protein